MHAFQLQLGSVKTTLDFSIDFRNLGRPVQSGHYPYTKMFVGMDSFYIGGES